MAIRHTFIFICFLLIVQQGTAQTQEIRIRQVSGINGLGLGRITSIMQDHNGVMWFTDETNKCLTRYDGKRMIPATPLPSLVSTRNASLKIQRAFSGLVSMEAAWTGLIPPQNDLSTSGTGRMNRAAC
jgi:hypothetical protein